MEEKAETSCRAESVIATFSDEREIGDMSPKLPATAQEMSEKIESPPSLYAITLFRQQNGTCKSNCKKNGSRSTNSDSEWRGWPLVHSQAEIAKYLTLITNMENMEQSVTTDMNMNLQSKLDQPKTANVI